jgi:hypothetical protein
MHRGSYHSPARQLYCDEALWYRLRAVLFDIHPKLHMYLMLEASLVHSLLQVRPKGDAHYLLSCSKRLN